jgi:hypothetical protein
MKMPKAETPVIETPVVPNPAPVPVAERHPVASELVSELQGRINVWDGIEPAEFNKITDAQSKEAVEQHLRDFARTHGADHPAVLEARNEWAKKRAAALAGYLGTLIGLIAKWVAVPPVKDALNDAEVSKHVIADREAAEAVNLEMSALALKYGEHSEVVDEGRRLWNTAIRVGRVAPVVVAEPVVA